jgi:hypothetical protein
MNPLEWLARMSDHIPDPGRHRTLFFGHYANRVRGERAHAEPGEENLHDQISIKRILDHLGLSEPEDERPPPPDVRYVPVDDEGREITAFS